MKSNRIESNEKMNFSFMLFFIAEPETHKNDSMDISPITPNRLH